MAHAIGMIEKIEHVDMLLHRLRFLLGGLLTVGGVVLFSYLIVAVGLHPDKATAYQAKTNASIQAIEMSDNPNRIASGLEIVSIRFGQGVGTVGYTISNGALYITSVTSRSGETIVNGGKAITKSVASTTAATGRVAGGSLAFVGRTIGGGAVAIVGFPGHLVGSVTNAAVLDTFIRPSEHEQIPIINPDSPELRAALNAMPAVKIADQTAPQSNAGPAWPIHGTITTPFGVAHWPYQPTHTGIDISDGRAPGITPIKPFRPGRVIEAIRSNNGLGNHIIIDHGNGVTSVYGHLASISVETGQDVIMDTTLGLEGSTGVSTGTHLHLEIRVNGQAADPRQFIDGQP